MKKTREYHICDRCKKEIDKDKINYTPYEMWFYELCDKCNELFDIFIKQINKLKNEWQDLEIEYQFGTYLPKDDLENKEENNI